jgi:hypothetical protein
MLSKHKALGSIERKKREEMRRGGEVRETN